MNEQRKQEGGCGCFGCFGTALLTLITIVELGVIWWMNPMWFDHVAFWRGARYEPDLVIVDDPALRAELESRQAEEPEREAREPVTSRTALRFDGAAVTGRYDPASGAQLSAPNGVALSVPPGAIDGPTELSLTPMLRLPPEMDAPFGGPIYDLRVGSSERYRFRRPVTLTLPCVPQGDGDPPVLATWDGNRWERVPSRYDASTGTVTATVDHASWWANLRKAANILPSPNLTLSTGLRWAGGGIAAALWLGSFGTVRAQGRALGWIGCEEYETPEGNFKIHYVTEGKDAVPTDAVYRASLGQHTSTLKSGPTTPEYIVDLGRLLEECRAGLDLAGLPLPRAEAICYDVFIKYLKKSDGESPPSGPLLFSNNLVQKASTVSVPVDELMRSTVAHELCHLAQGAYFGVHRASVEQWNFLWLRSLNILARQRWWCEATAEYLQYWYWNEQGRPTDLAFSIFVKGEGSLLTTPMDRAPDPQYYAYAAFPLWLDRRQKDSGFRFVEAANKGQDVSLAGLSAVATEVLGQSLPDVFTGFAHDFYHDDLWDGRRFPWFHDGLSPLTQALHQTDAPKKFRRVAYADGQQVVCNHWEHYLINSLPHLTAHAVYMDVGLLPKLQPAKLVVRIEPNSGVSKDLVVHLAEDICGGRLPASGDPGTLMPVALEAGKAAMHVVERVGRPGKVDRATVVAVNRSLTESAGGFGIQRWLLIPPPFVDGRRGNPPNTRRWVITWKHVGLKENSPVFSRYSVYTRRVGESNSDLRFVDDFEGNYGFFDAPDDEDYVFTLKVRDIYDNASHPAPIFDQDPFAGEWNLGLVRERYGLHINTAMDEIRAFAAAEVKKERDRINALPENTDHQRELKRQEREDQELAEEMVGHIIDLGEAFAPLFDLAVRAGLPVQLRITRKEHQYFLTVQTICSQPVTDPRLIEIPFERTGARTIRMKREGESKWPDVILHSPRDGIIRGDRALVHQAKSKHTGNEYKFSFGWWFKRGSEETSEEKP